ncbi:PAM68 family protein [Gloeobacter kilaueensis]|uniref:Uncharacterized protein n=1 Tax=Gloeobacter kilaueensis (strain ATCC BAA-2537 / CCAP 1431/1 / ULC 316 / JS1) TaxID=1183438 RepID=U5QQN9_GLOK1|nr:PAM68 family protein [Gloeobacter kilaueensis]AGY59934.1 hypothetical protein GKIL_3688 [Gloeobacter kilaueensis JS1]
MGRKSRTKREAALAGKTPAPVTPLIKNTGTGKDKLIIPKEINGRFLARILMFSGLPFALALLTEVIGATLIRSGLPVPNVVVLLVNLLFFGISVLGITYAILSTSWDPAVKGSLLGIKEFKQNGKRILSALQDEGQKRRMEQKS